MRRSIGVAVYAINIIVYTINIIICIIDYIDYTINIIICIINYIDYTIYIIVICISSRYLPTTHPPHPLHVTAIEYCTDHGSIQVRVRCQPAWRVLWPCARCLCCRPLLASATLVAGRRVRTCHVEPLPRVCV